jgi:hypothetical protein
MDVKAVKHDNDLVKIILSVPRNIGYDLEEIASFNEVTIENLTYSYIIEGISGDARVLKRTELEHHVNETLKKGDFQSKSVRE